MAECHGFKPDLMASYRQRRSTRAGTICVKVMAPKLLRRRCSNAEGGLMFQYHLLCLLCVHQGKQGNTTCVLGCLHHV